MKILQINNCDIKGGSSKVAYRLSKGLIKRGHDVTYLVAEKHANDSFVSEIESSNFPSNLEASFFREFDVIHLHDINGRENFFNLMGLTWLSKIKPVIWTTHTMWPFTGSCLYSYKCNRWKNSCGKCPYLGKFQLFYAKKDKSNTNIKLKKSIYKKSKLHIVGVSKWISELAKESMLNRFNTYTINNPVDKRIFHPINKQKVRERLRIPKNVNTILFVLGGSEPQQIRKGKNVIQKALTLLKTKNVFLIPLMITEGNKEFENIFKKFPFLDVKYIRDENELNLHYNAADVVWHPSLADTSSLIILESFSTGTPVIASNIGGPGEIVTDKKNGFLIESENSNQLAEKTDLFFSNKVDRKRMSENARLRVESNYSLELFLDNHENLYRKVISKR